ncbi:MAG: KamA family radical SAM protein [Nitrospinaceae bacterium]|nr:KamA family radical SAM protein [Nitrospinaceae bacterium]NIR53824.1 KamA family radical SAM protein [Nitrospinaceae bacterium]NIS84235.1 KamA family radical SAM protein [Nitrospinaceae bacterium]NIT81039.1 KamA family radical SAM protein [Nitrospinaceae bacterium]NIU43330.1 KamA family radical SAM protein [Nitrospinaceae bacterium]
MERWQRQLSDSAVKVEDLPFIPDAQEYRDKLNKVSEIFPIRINSYFLDQIKEANDPLWRQVVPTLEELDDFLNEEETLKIDPLNEEEDMPVPELVHRYPDRVLLMLNNHCPIICRFCTRKRKIGHPGIVTRETLRQGIEYISRHPEIRDVIMSGGDPLLVPDKELERILGALREIPHLEIIRIGTRVPGTLPDRITPALCDMLKKYHPIYANLHFNHPAEITPEVETACNRLADAGIPLGSQTVLLKGVNDDVETMKELVHKLLKIRVKPYYLYQADMTVGTDHFRTTVEKGLEIIQGLQGHTSGMGVPYFVIDTPGGGGKVRLLPDTVLEHNEREIIVKNFEGKTFRYPQPSGKKPKQSLPDHSLVSPSDPLCEMA